VGERAAPSGFPPLLSERGRFVEAYARLVYASIERTLRGVGAKRDADLVEDLFAAVFVAMFDDDARRLRLWHRRCSLETWLTLIASSVVRDHLRTERRFEARLDRRAGDVESTEPIDPRSLNGAAHIIEIKHDRDATARRVRAALGELADNDRRLLEAVYLAERSPSDVARELGLMMGALYTRKSRALERLRAALLRQGIDEDG